MRYGNHFYYVILHAPTNQYLDKYNGKIWLTPCFKKRNYDQIKEQYDWLKRKINNTPFINYKLTDFVVEKYETVITEIIL